MRTIVAMIFGAILMASNSALAGETPSARMYLLKWPYAAADFEKLPFRWEKKVITYALATRVYNFSYHYGRDCPVIYPARDILKRSQVTYAVFTAEVDKAIGRWSEVIDLQFVRVESEEEADVVIGATPPDQHYGKAYADLRVEPIHLGKMHRIAKGAICMHQMLAWTVQQVVATQPSIATTVTHEMGHVLGLAHPPDREGSVMAYNQLSAIPFTESDILGAQYLYGAPRKRKRLP